MSLLRAFWKDESAATAIEYGLIAALISVALISGVGAFSTNLQVMFNMLGNKISNPVP
jgi:pilus assembly protein Flp/PilA